MRHMRLLLGFLAVLSLASAALAQDRAKPIKIGVLTDLNSIFADVAGRGSVIAAEMAAQDAGGSVLGRPIETVSADHQNKADIASGIAARWFDAEGVGAIVDLPPSSVALAVQDLARKRGKITMVSASGSSELTGAACSPTGFQWTYSTVALARGTTSAVLDAGGSSWFFVTADYAYGHALEADSKLVIAARGGQTLGQVRFPLETSDFSSDLLQAQASGAKVIALANSGVNAINSIKQAAEFGIGRNGQRLVALTLFVSDVHSLGLEAAQGLQLTESFYWDLNDKTRAWSRRFAERSGGRMPTMAHAGVYSAVAHYLKAIKDAGTDEGKIVASRMRELPVNDFMTDHRQIRADGLVMRDFYLFQVKKPSESRGAWDYYGLVRTIPAEEAAAPEKGSGCPLLSPR
jgi:branched-chain amino acid transport system substrate-binding protein